VAELPKITLGDLDNAPASLPASQTATLSGKDTHVLYERLADVSRQKFEIEEEKSELLKKVARLESANDATQILDDLIKPYAKRVFNFMCVYCAFVGLAIVFDAFQIWSFNLEAGVMEFLVGSTAVTVIGLVGMVLTGIFVGARK
jgi:hypothetical protein